MNSLKIVFYIALLGFVSCKSTSESKNYKLEGNGLITDKGIIYALPKTNLTFKVEAIKTEVIPGPYYRYAEKLLGIEDAPQKDYIQWQINNIEIESYNDIDPKQYYILEPSGKFSVDFNKLIESHLIFPVNNMNQTNYSNNFYGKNEANGEIVFTDLSVSQYVGEEQVTYFKRVQRDSIFAKVPVVKTQSVYRSFEDKAIEAANFIFLIREKRFELLAGEADFYPEGKSLSEAIKELNRLENEYLDLFIGKRFNSTYTAYFEFTPVETDLEQPHIIFRFDEEKGILQPNDLRGRPIIVELEKLNQTGDLSFLFADQINREGTTYKDKLFYRIPDIAKLRIYDGNSLLANRKVQVYQFGVIVQIPSMFLMGNEKFIEFYREEK